MEKNRFKQGLLWLPAAAAMCMIFAFSQMNADASSDLSGGIVTELLRFFRAHGFAWLLDDAQTFSALEFLVRKCAHMSEYALLGALLVLPLVQNLKLHRLRLFGAAVLLAGVYACTDELHQLFVPGRSGRLFDVGVDVVGACIGALLAMGIGRLAARIGKRRKKGAYQF